MSSIVTDLDRKRTREFYLLPAGSITSALCGAAWFYWTGLNKFDTWFVDVPVLTVLLLIFVFCTWRIESDANCNGYCPDEPIKKD